ncbi:MAG: hypothetical protein ACM3TU_01310 [Bacillota bacterium]
MKFERIKSIPFAQGSPVPEKAPTPGPTLAEQLENLKQTIVRFEKRIADNRPANGDAMYEKAMGDQLAAMRQEAAELEKRLTEADNDETKIAA